MKIATKDSKNAASVPVVCNAQSSACPLYCFYLTRIYGVKSSDGWLSNAWIQQADMTLGANSDQVGCHGHAHQLLVVDQLHLHSIIEHICCKCY